MGEPIRRGGASVSFVAGEAEQLDVEQLEHADVFSCASRGDRRRRAGALAVGDLMIRPEPQDVIQQAAVTPAFIGAYQAAPAQITGPDGRVYRRDDARSAQERVWYLAAVAMRNPRLLSPVAHMDVLDMARGFDESQVQTDSRVRSAMDAKAAADEAITPLQAALKTAQEQKRAKFAEVRKKQSQIDVEKTLLKQNEDKRVNGALAFFTLGISAAVETVDRATRLSSGQGKIDGLMSELALLQADYKSLTDEVVARQREFDDAVAAQSVAAKTVDKAQDTVRKELRAAEEATRKQAQADAAAQAAADARANQAAAAAQQQDWLQQQQAGGGDYAGEEDLTWQSSDQSDWSSDTDFLDADEQADIYGDEDYAATMADLTDNELGKTIVISPYGFDEYYDGYSLDRDPVWGADTGQVVTGIIAGIIAAAPAVIKAVSPPPSKDASGADANPGAANSLGDEILTTLGLKKTLDDAATKAGAAAGAEAGNKTSSTLNTWLMFAAIGIAAIIVIKKA